VMRRSCYDYTRDQLSLDVAVLVAVRGQVARACNAERFSCTDVELLRLASQFGCPRNREGAEPVLIPLSIPGPSRSVPFRGAARGGALE